MAYRDLREFVAKLEKAGELKRVRAEVDPVLEITEVAQRVARDEKRAAHSVGPALLFEKPKGSQVPLLINTFGSVRRMELAFEVDKLEDVAARIQGFLEDGDAAGSVRQDEDVAEAGGVGLVFSEDGEVRRVQRSDQARARM